MIADLSPASRLAELTPQIPTPRSALRSPDQGRDERLVPEACEVRAQSDA